MLSVKFIILCVSFSFFPCAISHLEASFGLSGGFYHENGKIKAGLDFNASLVFNNIRLEHSFKALSAWKKSIKHDPFNFTANWEGPDVCSYNGVFCAKALDDPNIDVVGGLDLTGGEISGVLPKELGLLNDTALIHINSNKFTGNLPSSFVGLSMLREVDLSNNNFTGPFPMDLLNLPGLKYLDLRYNNFYGEIPKEVFEKDLDALFLNDNQFSGSVPENIGNSKVSVAVLANNELSGRIPNSIGKMSSTLNEFILSNNKIGGCLPGEIGSLHEATVFDVSFNSLVGRLPESMSGMSKIEEIRISSNNLSGNVPGELCELPELWNFNLSDNYFNNEDPKCDSLEGSDKVMYDNRNNCIPSGSEQKSEDECSAASKEPVDCAKICSVKKFQPAPSQSKGVSFSFSSNTHIDKDGIKTSRHGNLKGYGMLEREESSTGVWY